MKQQTKSKLILGMIIVSLTLIGVIRNESKVKYMDDNQNSKNDVISDLRDASSGNWDPPIIKSVGDYPTNAFIGDVDNDGYNDIAAANSNDDDISILLWNSSIEDWDPQITKSVGNYPISVFIGDANNDGFNDIVTANYWGDDVSILLWNSSIEDWDPQITKSVGDYPTNAFIGDVDNDAYNDIVTANYYDDTVSILRWNNSIKDWDPQITKSVGNYPRCAFIGDVDNDGYYDIATANSNNDTVSILRWNSSIEDWNPQITKSVGEHPVSVFIEDADNDGHNDIVTANNYDDTVSILRWNNSIEDWDPQITKPAGAYIYPNSMFIEDVDNDGYNDIATTNYIDDTVSILLWNSSIEDWDPYVTKSVGNYPVSVFIGDANNDGFNDIVTANYYDDIVSILLWKLPYISIISPENKVYGPLSGCYPATYGFENDIDKNRKIPYGWTNVTLGYPDNFIELRPEYNDHKNVLMGQVAGPGSWNLINLLNATEGTIEFWFCCITEGTSLYFGPDQLDNEISFDGGNIRYHVSLGGGSYIFQTIGQYNPGEWDHLRIDFRCDSGSPYEGLNQNEFRVYINEVDSGTYAFNSPKDFEYLQFAAGNMCLDAFGFSWDPSYTVGDNLNEGMRLSFFNNTRLDCFDWIKYSLDGQDNITIFEQEIIPLPEDGLHSIQLFVRASESGEVVEGEIRYFTVDTISPEIIIHSPFEGEAYGCMAPKYNNSFIEANLESMWYTIDGGITNFTINKLSGFIDQHAWIDAPLGLITVRFYIKDVLNRTNYEEAVITKTKLLSIDIINQSFSSSEFSIEFSVHNESSEAIDFALIQMWWDGIDVSSIVQNLGNGLYFISLEPIKVAFGEDPILLNMTISALGYEEKYFETYIAVEPIDLSEDKIELEIVDQFFSTEEFNITFFIHNKTGYGIEFATLQVWWNGVNVSINVQNLGGGLYFISLEPITVAPGEDPILLSITISIDEFEDKHFETYIAVDPDTLEKDLGKSPPEDPLLIFIITITSVAGGIGVAGITVFLLRKRKRLNVSN